MIVLLLLSLLLLLLLLLLECRLSVNRLRYRQYYKPHMTQCAYRQCGWRCVNCWQSEARCLSTGRRRRSTHGTRTNIHRHCDRLPHPHVTRRCSPIVTIIINHSINSSDTLSALASVHHDSCLVHTADKTRQSLSCTCRWCELGLTDWTRQASRKNRAKFCGIAIMQRCFLRLCMSTCKWLLNPLVEQSCAV